MTTRNSPGLRRCLGPVVGVLLALVGLWPIVGQAQTTVVSTLNNPDGGHARFVGWSEGDWRGAQPFRTGSAAGGYHLHSIAVRFHNLGFSTYGTLTVRLRESAPDGRPGDVLHTLARTSSVDPHGVNEFRAPAGVVLAPDTWYHLDLGYLQRSGTVLRWLVARSAAAGNGWEISAPLYTMSRSGPWYAENAVFKMAIKASELSPVTLSLSSDRIGEAGGVSTVTASLLQSLNEDTTVTVEVTPESSATADDYRLSGSRLTIPAGGTASEGLVTITAVDNDLYEGDKGLRVSARVTNTQGDTHPLAVTLTIAEDEEPPPELSIEDASVAEGDAGGAAMAFRVTLDRAATKAVTVDWETRANQTASAGADFTAADGSLAFAVGETEKTVSVTVLGDDVDERDETFRVVLSNASQGVKVVDGGATGTIRDDDDPPRVTLSLSPASISESGGESALTAGLSHPSSEATTVTASASGHYALSSNGVLTIPAGGTESVGAVTVTALDNNVDAPDRSVAVSAAAENVLGIVGPQAVSLTIEDDEAPPTVTLHLSPASISESGGESALTAGLSHPSSEATTVTASASGHYALSSNGVLTIPAGEKESVGAVTVTALDNNVDAPDRSVAVSAAAENVLGIVGPQAVSLTIEDDEAPPTVTLHLSPASISESGGESALTARLSHPSSAETTVTVSASGHYGLGSNGVLTIPAGETESVGAVTVTGVDDDLDAPDKAVAVTASAENAQGVVGPQSVTLTITDDDRRRLSIANARLAEGDSGDGEMAFAVTLSRASAGVVTVDWATSDVTAEAGTDYRAGDGSLRFGVGDLRKTVSVRVTGDRTDEPNETFRVSLSNVSGAVLGKALATGTIRDDDATPRAALSLSPGVIGGDGGVSVVTAGLDRPSSEGTTVTVSASPGGHVLSSNRELRIPAGETESVGLVTISATSTPLFVSGTSTPAAIGGHRTVMVSGTAENDLGVVGPEGVALAIAGPALAPFLPPASAPGLEGFVRVLNHADAAGEVSIEAIDDAGVSAGTVTLSIAAKSARHFNAMDLEEGNPDKGIAKGVGAGQGGWRLVLRSALPVTALSYVRTDDGLVAPMHDVAPAAEGGLHVAFFNPASNLGQMSGLRLVNLGGREAEVTVAGTDDAGFTPDAAASIAVPAGGAADLTADELEAALGDGAGKWRLAARSSEPVLAMSLVASPSGHLVNLSTVPAAPGDGGAHVVPFFPSASDAFGRQGFLRVANRSAQAGEVAVSARDDSEFVYEEVTLAIGAGATRHLNSDDLELGNAGKGLRGSTGSGVGDWRLELASGLDLEVLAYVRMSDGLLASMHDVAPTLADGTHWVAFFNAADNLDQTSSLRLVNPGAADAAVRITGIDDQGASPGGAVTLTVPAGSARTLGAAELEGGAAELDFADGLEGSLGDGSGKWRLRVVSDEPILVMSLLTGPGGYLTNLSSAPRRGLR